jgi:hypothetical protein
MDDKLIKSKSTMRGLGSYSFGGSKSDPVALRDIMRDMARKARSDATLAFG